MKERNDDPDADDAAAAANTRRVEVMATSSIVDRGPRVRFSYAAPWADGSSGNTSGLHPEIPGSNPGRSTMYIHHDSLWRLCTDSASYRSRPGGTAGLQNRRVEFDSLAACLMAGGRVVKAPVCKTGFRGFESRPAIQHDDVVTPTQGPRTGAYHPAPG